MRWERLWARSWWQAARPRPMLEPVYDAGLGGEGEGFGEFGGGR
jgi:hypothetical protein